MAMNWSGISSAGTAASAPMYSSIRREALVQPQLAPPCGGDEVAEPLVAQLVGDDCGHPLEVVDVVDGGIPEEASSAYLDTATTTAQPRRQGRGSVETCREEDHRHGSDVMAL